MSINTGTDFFLDFQQFGELKLRARDDSGDAAQAVARQFEGLLVQQMLAAMRSASSIDTGQQSSYLEFYQEMYDKQLAQTIAGQDRLGVAKMIMQQIPVRGDGATSTTIEPVLETPLIASPMVPGGATTPAAPDVDKTGSFGPAVPIASGGALAYRVIDNDFAEINRIEKADSRWQRPDLFVADIWPQARAYAQNLGVSAELLVAQAALETGWGRHMMKFDDGRSSYNLFGIKAGPEWPGSSLSRTSLEYRDGTLQNQVSRFRAYASPAQSLADYVDFIQSSPRYREALDAKGNDEAYIRAIHDAGYATDPQYADKVIGILNGDLLQRSLASLGQGVTDHA
ncbi:MAG: flagellar assembly peptidoglycan hydrolase FlgJ [Gammaproteobacteria bacterium]|nr:flagellar assembly peptidoglycan hydrolase FlgJ [Gammaproteobacteria bacterium]MDH3448360.1 flagellar assembly peptidoglycan hydrolase FlgJ [Gammaproteobacteria bacterium]